MNPIGILATTATVALSSVASVIAQATTDGGSIVTITSAGATASAVGALIYVARLMATGQLIAKSTAEAERLQAAAQTIQLEVNRDLVEIIKDARRREDRFYLLVSTGKLPPPIEDNR